MKKMANVFSGEQVRHYVALRWTWILSVREEGPSGEGTKSRAGEQGAG